MFHKKQMLKELQLSQKIYNSYVVQYTMEDWNKGQGCWGGLRGSLEVRMRLGCLQDGPCATGTGKELHKGLRRAGGT